MNKNKSLYEAPNTDVLVVRFEQNIMSVTNGVNWGSSANYAGGDDAYDLNDGEDF